MYNYQPYGAPSIPMRQLNTTRGLVASTLF